MLLTILAFHKRFTFSLKNNFFFRFSRNRYFFHKRSQLRGSQQLGFNGKGVQILRTF